MTEPQQSKRPRPIEFRALREASFVMLEVFVRVEEEIRADDPRADPPALTHGELLTWVRRVDPDRFGKLLAGAPREDHLLRQWVAKAVEDGVIERVDGGARTALHMLTTAGRHLSQLPAID